MYLLTLDHDYSVTFNNLYKAYTAYYAAVLFADEINVDVTLIDDTTGELLAWNNDEE